MGTKEYEKFGQQIINIDLRKTNDKGKPIKNGGKIIVHPGYRGENVVDNVYSPDDIAIIILPTEVKFPSKSDYGIRNEIQKGSKIKSGTFVRPVCMPDINKNPARNSTQLLISGYGYTNKEDVANTTLSRTLHPSNKSWQTKSDVLLKAHVKYLPHEDCDNQNKEEYSEFFEDESVNLSRKQLCAYGEADTCKGDSGGPAVSMVDITDQNLLAKKAGRIGGDNKLGLCMWTDISWCLHSSVGVYGLDQKISLMEKRLKELEID